MLTATSKTRRSFSEFAVLFSIWLISTWPVLIPSALLLWIVFVGVPCVWLPVGMQVFGGGLFALYAMNGTLKALNRPSLRQRASSWGRSFPRLWVATVTASASVPGPLGQPVVSVRVTSHEASEVDRRIHALEAEVQALRMQQSKMASEIQQSNKATNGVEAKWRKLEAALVKIHEDGLGLQVCGVLLAVAGTIGGALG